MCLLSSNLSKRSLQEIAPRDLLTQNKMMERLKHFGFPCGLYCRHERSENMSNFISSKECSTCVLSPDGGDDDGLVGWERVNAKRQPEAIRSTTIHLEFTGWR